MKDRSNVAYHRGNSSGSLPARAGGFGGIAMKIGDDQRKTNNEKVGESVRRKESNVNRLICLNNLIEYDWLNLSFNCYKICCKDKLLN